ncbi:hypothetical protein ACCO45_008803 [Purpureocillium lilacinum]|uniref:Uncharacterized protein n=1 Tax=Purpureocillium lilacinum TaxID=33203 RepID=A0ACC4DHX1_PURLI
MPGPPTRGRHLPRLSVTCKVQVHRGSATPAPAPAARGPCEQPTVPRPRLLVGGQRQSTKTPLLIHVAHHDCPIEPTWVLPVATVDTELPDCCARPCTIDREIPLP